MTRYEISRGILAPKEEPLKEPSIPLLKHPRLIIIGSRCSGKTSLLLRYIENLTFEQTPASIYAHNSTARSTLYQKWLERNNAKNIDFLISKNLTRLCLLRGRRVNSIFIDEVSLCGINVSRPINLHYILTMRDLELIPNIIITCEYMDFIEYISNIPTSRNSHKHFFTPYKDIQTLRINGCEWFIQKI